MREGNYLLLNNIKQSFDDREIPKGLNSLHELINGNTELLGSFRKELAQINAPFEDVSQRIDPIKSKIEKDIFDKEIYSKLKSLAKSGNLSTLENEFSLLHARKNQLQKKISRATINNEDKNIETHKLTESVFEACLKLREILFIDKYDAHKKTIDTFIRNIESSITLKAGDSIKNAELPANNSSQNNKIEWFVGVIILILLASVTVSQVNFFDKKTPENEPKLPAEPTIPIIEIPKPEEPTPPIANIKNTITKPRKEEPSSTNPVMVSPKLDVLQNEKQEDNTGTNPIPNPNDAPYFSKMDSPIELFVESLEELYSCKRPLINILSSVFDIQINSCNDVDIEIKEEEIVWKRGEIPKNNKIRICVTSKIIGPNQKKLLKLLTESNGFKLINNAQNNHSKYFINCE